MWLYKYKALNKQDIELVLHSIHWSIILNRPHQGCDCLYKCGVWVSYLIVFWPVERKCCWSAADFMASLSPTRGQEGEQPFVRLQYLLYGSTGTFWGTAGTLCDVIGPTQFCFFSPHSFRPTRNILLSRFCWSAQIGFIISSFWYLCL